MMLRRLRSFASWILGFFLVTNVYLIPTTTQTPRATDVIGMCLGLWLMWRLTNGGMRFGVLVTLFMFTSIPMIWGLHAYFMGDTSTVLLSIRWLLAVPWAYVLYLVARDSQRRTLLIWGILCGCLVNVAVLPFQYYGSLEFIQGLGLAAQDTIFSYIDEDLRASGMEGHPNSSAAILSLAVPLSLYLYNVEGARIWVVGLGLAIVLAGAQFTETRSAVLVSLVTVVVMSFARRNFGRSARVVASVVYLGLPLLFWVGPPGGWERWLDRSRLEVNSGERLLSNEGALRLSFEHPFGLGVDAGTQALYQETGLRATHNAFLQIGLTYGPLLAAAIFLLLFFLALQIFVKSHTIPVLEALLALHVFGLFFFEEHFSAPTFTIVFMWLVAASAVPLSYYLRATRPRDLTAGRRVQRQQQPSSRA